MGRSCPIRDAGLSYGSFFFFSSAMNACLAARVPGKRGWPRRAGSVSPVQYGLEASLHHAAPTGIETELNLNS